MNQSNRTKNSLFNLISGVFGQLLTLVLNFITRTVFIYTLGKAYLGINGLFSDILVMLSLSELGFDTAINFKLYKPIADNNEKKIRILLKFYKNAYRIVGIVIFILGILMIPMLKYLINDYNSLAALNINASLIFILYLLQSVSSYLFFAYRSVIVKACQKEYVLNISSYIVTFISNIAQIVVLIYYKNFIMYTTIMIIFNIIQNLVNAKIAEKMYPNYFVKEQESLSKNEIFDLLRDCGALFIYKVNGVVLKATDNLILSRYIGLVIVGLYSNYLLIYTTIKNFLGKFYNAIKASMGNIYATEGLEKKYFYFEFMNFLTIILYGTACIGVTVLANEVIKCWIGENYIIPQPFPLLLGVEIMIWGLKANLGQIRNITGAFRQMWFRPILGIIINLFVSILGVKYYGINGVLLGTIIADISTYFIVDPVIIYRFSFKEAYSVSQYYKTNFKYLLILFIIGFLNYIVCSHIVIEPRVLSLLVHLLFCGISVPFTFVIIYWRKPVCKYLRHKIYQICRGKVK